MTKGYDKNKERLNTLSLFTKDLVRRSNSGCELCEEKNVRLETFEVPPIDDEPDFDKCIIICETCKEQIKNQKKFNPLRWRFLSKSIWSDIPAVQVMSVKILTKISDEGWAAELLDQIYLDEKLQKWADSK